MLDLDVATEERGEKDLEEVKTLVGDIEERLGRLSRLKRERETSLKDLKELVSRDRSLSSLSSFLALGFDGVVSLARLF